MNKYKLALLLIIPLLCCTSCEEWLKVDSEDRIMEDALYSNENGFRTALNGIYIDLLNSSLYGQTLTTTTFDVLAQYYDTSKPLNTHAYVLLANYDHQKMKDAVSDTWAKGYALIGNINTLLEHCEKNGINTEGMKVDADTVDMLLALRGPVVPFGGENAG